MRARIQPLGGKYYGTRITFEGKCIDVWTGLGREPSARQLSEWGNEPMDADMLRDMMCDGHYETATDLRIAEAIVKALEWVDVQ